MIGDISKADIQQNDQASDVISYIKSLYERDQMNEFVRKVNEVLRIIYKTNIDVSESVSNLLFCVFEIYNPEMYESIVNEQKEEKLKQS